MKSDRSYVTTWMVVALVTLLIACGREGFEAVDSHCQGVNCGGHGFCVDLGTEARCVCDQGYHQEGLDCASDVGVCDGIDCSGHGRCVIHNGQAACFCDRGYHSGGGTDCIADGSQCDMIDCSGHGTCGIAADGSPICACLPGYHNNGPTTCVPDPGSGKCADEKDCDDNNDCTIDVCTPAGECQHAYSTGPCDDDLYCTENDTCDGAGNCISGPPRDCSAAGGECLLGVCDEDQDTCERQPAPDGFECGARYCDGIDWKRQTCQNGICRGIQLLQSCEDGDSCTADLCDGATGCANLGAPDGTECGARYCSGLDWMRQTCQGGSCTGSARLQACDDSNVCTDDSCDATAGCGHVNNTNACNDQNACSMNDACSNGVCSGEPLDGDSDNFVSDVCGGNDCDDSNPDINPGVFEGPEGAAVCSDTFDNDCDGLTDLNDDTCRQCTSAADCDDNDVCNGLETCVATQCVAGTPLSCDDGDFCNGTETCDAVAGCQASTPPCLGTECNRCQEDTDTCFDPPGAPCADDGQYCTGSEACDGAGACASSGNPCAETDCNHCQEASGSCFDPPGAPCTDDGLYCTGTESCDGAGTCTSSGDPCTGTECNNCNEPADSCFDPPGIPCADDGQYCTGDETCDGAGSCVSFGDPCPGTMCNTCQEDLDNCFDPPIDSCNDGLYCTATDMCDGAGSCVGSGSPCEAGEVCIESTDTCQLSSCTSEPDCTPCNDGLYCTAEDGCINGECVGFGDPCGASEICNEATDSCDAECGTDCSSLDDQCNTGICNPSSGQCEVKPMPIGAACAPDGGSQYMFCLNGKCTHWCNNSFELPGDSDHECPAGCSCEEFIDKDSAGYCKANSFGTLEIGEECTDDGQCRSDDCSPYITPHRCSGCCSSIIDCKDTGPDTSGWSCLAVDISGSHTHGRCRPSTGSGRTGDSCSFYTDCRDGYCRDGSDECADLCCTEDDCPAGYTCWFENHIKDSYMKVCTDMGALGTDAFGTPCSGSGYFDSDCATGLCVDVGAGQQCNRFCCRDTDCPIDYRCDFAISEKGDIRACVPDVDRLPESTPSACLDGDTCGLPIVVVTFPANINDDNTVFSSFFNPHGSPSISCTGFSYWGPDVIYEILVPSGDNLTATLDPPSGVDLGLYLLDVCVQDFEESNCLAGDDDDGKDRVESIEWRNTGADATVYLVVDGWEPGVGGAYALDIDVAP